MDMHAVLVSANIGDRAVAEPFLHSEVVPQVAKAPGLVAAYWLAPDGGTTGQGTAIVVFESEEQAQAMSEQVEAAAGPTVTIESISVREVVANI
jgi:hypothetical protein